MNIRLENWLYYDLLQWTHGIGTLYVASSSAPPLKTQYHNYVFIYHYVNLQRMYLYIVNLTLWQLFTNDFRFIIGFLTFG